MTDLENFVIVVCIEIRSASMCGVIGVIQKGGSFSKLDRFDSLMKHRGPDSTGYFESHSKKAKLRFYRLAIIDLDSGEQPSYNQEKNIISVFNGEIYNYKELREELSSLGFQFKTRGDAEVIPFLYEYYGLKFIDKLEGMFSILIWDERRGEFYAFRDRFGIKPLHYVENDDYYLFSSEVKPLKEALGRLEIDSQAVEEYFSYGFTLSRSLFKGLKKVQNSHYIKIDQQGKLHEFRYWDLKQEGQSWSHEGLIESFDQGLKLHLRSDVKVGMFLSGGYDSGLIAARLSEMDQKVTAYTVKFKEAPLDESQVAAKIAKNLGIEHKIFEVTFDDLFGFTPQILWHCDEPLADSGIFPNYYLSKMARGEDCKVILVGTGGDEVFAGYGYHVRSALENKVKPFEKALLPLLKYLPLPQGTKRKLMRTCSYQLDPIGHYLGHTQVFHDLRFLKQYGLETKKGQLLKRFEGDGQTARLYADLNSYIPENLMVLFDRATMAHSMEGRVPFLHHPFVEYAFNIKEAARTPQGRRKGLMKDVIQNYLPKEVFELPKMGFNSPVREWSSQKHIKSKIEGVLRSERFLERPCFDSNILRKTNIEKLNFHQLWTLFQFELFLRVHYDHNYELDKLPSVEELLRS